MKNQNPPLPIWQKRPNMGASPLAIETAETIRKEIEGFEERLQPILIAALVDAAIRKSGAPELLEALEKTLSWAEWYASAGDIDTVTGAGPLSQDCRQARAAIAKATRPNV